MLVWKMPLTIEIAPRTMKKVEVAILSHFMGSRERSFAPMSMVRISYKFFRIGVSCTCKRFISL